MSIRDDFFAAQAKASLWDVAVSIKRGNPLPLDANAVYASYGVLVNTEVVDGVEKHTYTAGSLLEYAKTNPVAYPGQICAVVGEDATTIYYLDQNLEIQPVGIIPTGDNKTIEVTAQGAISLLGANTAPNGTLPMIDAETGKLVWKTLEDIGAGDGNDNTTYTFELGEDGVSFIVTPLFNGQPIYEGEGEERVQVKTTIALDVHTKKEVDDAIKVVADKIGVAAEGQTGTLYELIAAEVLRATTAEGALGDRIGVAKNGENAATGVYAYVDGVVNALVNGVDADKIDSLNELIEWVEEHPAIVEELDGRLDKVEGILDGIGGEGEKATVVEYVADALNAYTNTEALGGLLDDKVDNETLNNYYTKTEADDKYVTKTTATAEDGLRFINQSEINKLAKLNLDNGEITISGSVNANQVKELYNTVVNIVKGSTADLDPGTEGAQNGLGIEEGAEVNVIEEIQINGTKVAPNTNRVVNLELSTDSLSDKQALTKSINDAAALGQKGIDDASSAQGTANEALGATKTNAGNIATLQGIVSGLQENGSDGLVARLAALEAEVRVDVDARLDSLEGTLNGNGEGDTGLVGVVTGHTKQITDLGTADARIEKKADDNATAILALQNKVNTGDKTVSAYVTEALLPYALAENVYTKNEVYTKDETNAEIKKVSDAVGKIDLTPYATNERVDGIYKVEGEAKTGVLADALVDVAANKTAIALLNDAADKEGSVKHTVATELAKIISDTDADIDTLNEIAAWIINDQTGAAKMANDIAALNTKVDTGDQKVSEYVAGKIAEAAYILPAATVAALGGIKSAADVEGKVVANKVYVDATTNVGEVKAISTDLLVQGDTELILNGGNAALN